MKTKGATWIDRTLVESPYYIGLCKTEKQYRNELKRLHVSEDDEWVEADKDANVRELISPDGTEMVYLVSIRERSGTKPIEIIGLLIHESVHVFRKIKENLGEDDPSAEFEAYSIQHIAQNLIEAYGKIKT